MSDRECSARRQVCNTTAGLCVDCETNVDCTNGRVCRGNVCVDPPRTCQSSRECSGMGLVCDTTHNVCVECFADTDCPMDRYCGLGLTCVPRVCAPGARTCVSATRVGVCDARGASQTTTDCPTGQSCAMGTCQALTCSPGAMSCDPMTSQRRLCNADGSGYTPMPCATGETCQSGTCVGQMCVPGSSMCLDARTLRVCRGDGSGFMNMECPSMSTCAGMMCTGQVCAPGAVTCPVGTNSRTVCNADGLGISSAPCTAPANAMTPICGAGNACAFTCMAGFGDCNHLAGDGCEGQFSSDVTNCGVCGNACLQRLHNTGTCAAGVCSYHCDMGFGNCDGNSANGCETDLRASAANCGRCGNACPTGMRCIDGVCGV